MIALVLLCSVATAQKTQKTRDVENLPHFDRKWIHFGFTLGVNSADFVLNQDLGQVDSLLILESQRQLGFNLGIVSDLHMGPNFSLRFVPALSFSQRNLEYTKLTDSDFPIQQTVKPVESTYIELPLNLKFRSNRDKNFAAYLLGGGKYSIDLASQQKTDNTILVPADQVVKIQRLSYSAEVGFGMDFFLEYFKFSPEIKYSIGLQNVHVHDDTEWAAPIIRLVPTMLLISLNFEG